MTVMVITGDGKGKTTSALGQAVRAMGSGADVLIIQFYKNDETAGDYRILSQLGTKQTVEFYQYGAKCLHPETRAATECLTCGECLKDRTLLRKRVLAALEKVQTKNKEYTYDVIILDEILRALDFQHISLEEIQELVKSDKKMLWILTGRMTARSADSWKSLIELADYFQEIVQIKHPFDNGTKARRGIEI